MKCGKNDREICGLARENIRKNAREKSKVPVTHFTKKCVTGTLGFHGKKKTLVLTVLTILCGEEGVECFVSFHFFDGKLFSDSFNSFEGGCFGRLDSFDSFESLKWGGLSFWTVFITFFGGVCFGFRVFRQF